MKIKVLGDQKIKDEVVSTLNNLSFEVVEESEEYIIMPSSMRNRILGRDGDILYPIDPQEIFYFEAEGNDTVCVTKTQSCYVKEKIYQIEATLSEEGFVRVSRSHVINAKQIKAIKPQSNMKFRLLMNNGTVILVTRSYYYIFKEFIGI